jgi:hypothetical protein
MFGLLIGLFFFGRYVVGPPKEAALLRNFYAHRSSFEELRDMLRADPDVYEVTDRGVATRTDPTAERKPGAGGFPADRYQKYLALLKETRSRIVQQAPGADHEILAGVWGSGFGGETAHIDISWREEPPSRQVSSFDSYYRDHKSSGPGGWVYRHIDSNWYLRTDLWTR